MVIAGPLLARSVGVYGHRLFYRVAPLGWHGVPGSRGEPGLTEAPAA